MCFVDLLSIRACVRLSFLSLISRSRSWIRCWLWVVWVSVMPVVDRSFLLAFDLLEKIDDHDDNIFWKMIWFVFLVLEILLTVLSPDRRRVVHDFLALSSSSSSSGHFVIVSFLWGDCSSLTSVVSLSWEVIWFELIFGNSCPSFIFSSTTTPNHSVGFSWCLISFFTFLCLFWSLLAAFLCFLARIPFLI